jgi:hypothetical protein
LAYKFAKLAVYVLAAWFVWVSWRAVPHFSGGLDEGMAYYRSEAQQTLRDFTAAGDSVARAVWVRVEAMNLFASSPMDERAPKGRFRTLEE